SGRTTTTRLGSKVPFEESSVRATSGEPSALAWRPTRRVVQGMGGILGMGRWVEGSDHGASAESTVDPRTTLLQWRASSPIRSPADQGLSSGLAPACVGVLTCRGRSPLRGGLVAARVEEIRIPGDAHEGRGEAGEVVVDQAGQ